MSISPKKVKGSPPKRPQIEGIFSTKRQLKSFFHKLEGSISTLADKDAELANRRAEEAKNHALSSELQKLLNFPKVDYTSMPMRPLCPSLLELYNLSHGRAINIHVPPTIIVTGESECFLMRSDDRGWVQTEPKFDPKNILDMLKTFFEDPVVVPGDDQRYIVKSYEPFTNTNIAVTYNNRYVMHEDIKKIIGVEAFLIQKYVMPKNKKPQIYRVDIARNNYLQVYKIKLKKNEENTLEDAKNAVTERKMNIRRLSTMNLALQLLNVKDDQVTKHCVSSVDALSLKTKKMVGARVPEIEKEALKIKEIYERYVFSPKAIRLTRFVVDFLPSQDGKLYFLQIKHFEGESKFLYDPKLLKKIKVRKGLMDNEYECKGVFCKSIKSTPVLNELIHLLTRSESINSQWNKFGVYLIPHKLLKDYKIEMAGFEYILSAYFNRKVNNIKNVLSPLVAVDIDQTEKDILSYRSKSVSAEYEPQHVCELCHRIYKLYGNKKTMLLGCDAGLCNALVTLSQKPIESWTASDAKFILEVYGHTLPAIKSTNNQGIRKYRGLKHRNFFYGYQSIVETPIPVLVPETERTQPVSEAVKRDYVKLNKLRSTSSQPHLKKSKEKITKFENSAAPKVTGPDDILSLYKLAEKSQRHLIERLKRSLHKGHLN